MRRSSRGTGHDPLRTACSSANLADRSSADSGSCSRNSEACLRVRHASAAFGTEASAGSGPRTEVIGSGGEPVRLCGSGWHSRCDCANDHTDELVKVVMTYQCIGDPTEAQLQ
ncbi:GPI transamidase component GPI16 [Pseudozyma hubeiensis SY62]|uniref:GPI transamidase component GPI16 n=1 Tax=Pseudozyma hubeiensis (strain SY62) TaxID=1305764 RepID=R9PE45_PSEHS|nr:GPI transamidase component GPI16 [Pseudozyma hubeiensis SY62]GAC96335.1 GPI transamidase component GPI16 [Pseudozyma hubeiensis SY62]